MPIKGIFEPVEAMTVRRGFGGLVNKVSYNNQRFVIERKGQPMALLVPVTDAKLISRGIEHQDEGLDAVYTALERVKGVITDPAMHDASSTIDDWLYGDTARKQAEEHGE